MGKKFENFKFKLWLLYKEYKIILVYWDKKIFKLIILYLIKNCVYLIEKNVFCLFIVYERKSARYY